MKLQFEPYVLEPFDDWYVFPKQETELMNLFYRDYQDELVESQYDYHQKLRDLQREQQQRIAELHRYFQEELKGIPRHNSHHEYPSQDRLRP